MSQRGGRVPVRVSRRRKNVIGLDLNSAPPGENRDLGGTSTQVEPQDGQASLQGQSAIPTPIDVEAIDDDDVIISSPRAFAEAKNNSRRNRGRTIVDVDSEERTRVSHINKRRRVATSQTIINCDFYINLESSSNPTKEKVTQPPPPPKEPTFTCPICMAPLVEEMSTKCGHIFCKACIKSAIGVQGKCPTCRRKVTMKELIRVFLPTTC